MVRLRIFILVHVHITLHYITLHYITLHYITLHYNLNLLGGERRYLRLTSKQSIQFFHKRLIIKYASNMQYVVSCLWFLFNAKIYSCLFPAVALLACLRKSLACYDGRVDKLNII